jgi:hypothetical protein
MYVAGSYMWGLLVYWLATGRRCDGTVSILLVIRQSRTCGRRRRRRRWTTP